MWKIQNTKNVSFNEKPLNSQHQHDGGCFCSLGCHADQNDVSRHTGPINEHLLQKLFQYTLGQTRSIIKVGREKKEDSGSCLHLPHKPVQPCHQRDTLIRAMIWRKQERGFVLNWAYPGNVEGIKWSGGEVKERFDLKGLKVWAVRVGFSEITEETQNVINNEMYCVTGAMVLTLRTVRDGTCLFVRCLTWGF